MDRFIKICVGVALAIALIVVFFIVWNNNDGHLDVVDGAPVMGGDNWLLINSQTAQAPRYYKVGEVGEVEGLTRETQEQVISASRMPTYRYTIDGVSREEQLITLGMAASDYKNYSAKSLEDYRGIYPSATFSEIDERDVGGKKARSFSFEHSYEMPAAADAEVQEPTTTYGRYAYTFLEMKEGRTLSINFIAVNGDQAALPSLAQMQEMLDKVAAQITFD